MKRITLIALMAGAAGAWADVNPSKDVQPDKFANPNPEHFDIFAGDPKRIQKANEINFTLVASKLLVDPAQIIVAQATASTQDRPTLKMTFQVKNNNKQTITLSYPDAKRFDVTIKDPSGQAIYVWSADKQFVQTVATSRINPTESDAYVINVDLGKISTPLHAGKYTAEAVLANYPQVTAQADLVIQ